MEGKGRDNMSGLQVCHCKGKPTALLFRQKQAGLGV